MAKDLLMPGKPLVADGEIAELEFNGMAPGFKSQSEERLASLHGLIVSLRRRRP